MASPEFEELRKVLKPGLAVASDPFALVREKMHAIHPTEYGPDVEVERLALSKAARSSELHGWVTLAVGGEAYVTKQTGRLPAHLRQQYQQVRRVPLCGGGVRVWTRRQI